MSWVRLDDRWRGHEKMLHAIHLAGSPLVKWLWVEALSECNDHRTDGVVKVYRYAGICDSAGVPKSKRDPFRTALVVSGLWHDAETVRRCRTCVATLAHHGHTLAEGDLYHHDYDDKQKTKKDQETPELNRKANQRLALRRDERLCQLIYERDAGLCRYCGVRVTQKINDHRSRSRLTRDHVDPACFDPNDGNTLENVVIACAHCNETKGERTPDEAGMPLLPPGTTAHDVAVGNVRGTWDGWEADSDEPDDGRRIADPTDPGPRADRTDRARNVGGAGSGRDRVGPGSDRSGSGRSGGGQRRSREGPGAGTARGQPP